MEKSGPGANKFQPGQRVVAAGWAAGTWQDYVVQPEKSLVGFADCFHAADCSAACSCGSDMLQTAVQRAIAAARQLQAPAAVCDRPTAFDTTHICHVDASWGADPPTMMTDDDSNACFLCSWRCRRSWMTRRPRSSM